tara:strand:+ start:222 stop:341 length:120 start_codon:yes stop_codon:yes gene_type:complete
MRYTTVLLLLLAGCATTAEEDAFIGGALGILEAALRFGG